MRYREKMDDSLRCSFCHKSQGVVKKLISSPRDYPRAYICDECIAVCAAIVEDDRAPQDSAADSREPHPLLSHPLASEFMDSVAAWIMQESLGQPAAEELGRVRTLASRMLSN